VLTRAQKEEQVTVLREKLNRASSVFVADYRGLTVDETNVLRTELRGEDPTDSEYTVTKNAVLKLAVADTDLSILSDCFSGPTSIAIAYGDPARVAKVLVECGKKNEAFEIKGGFLDGQSIGVEGVAKLATLPSLLELRGKIVGLIQAPASKLARLLNEPGGQIARLVDARAKALEEGGS